MMVPMKLVVAAVALFAFAAACVPSPDYTSRRLAVPEEEEEEQELEPADSGVVQENPMSSDTGVPAMSAQPDATTTTQPDAGIEDAGMQPPPPDAGDPGSPDAASSGGSLAFGATCATDADCASAMCRTFGQLGLVCTQICAIDADCPSGSMGQKCNQQGLCRP
jgi:hypothetical protein